MKQFITVALLFCCCQVASEQVKQWRGYEIHYTTFPSTLISAETANTHGITRAGNRLVTNISVRRDGKSQRVFINGNYRNLLDQQYALEFREIVERDAVYYLANQVISETDTIRFDITIQPIHETETYHLRFKRDYF